MEIRGGARVAGLVLVGILALGGCGDDEEPAEATPTPTPIPTVAPTPTATATPTPEPPPEPETASEVYTVESGDTLSSIANRFGTTVEAIVEANDIADPDRISIGDEFVIPAPQP